MLSDFRYFIMKTPYKTGIMDLRPVAGFQERVDAYIYFNARLAKATEVPHAFSILTQSQLAEALIDE